MQFCVFSAGNAKNNRRLNSAATGNQAVVKQPELQRGRSRERYFLARLPAPAGVFALQAHQKRYWLVPTYGRDPREYALILVVGGLVTLAGLLLRWVGCGL